MNTLKKCSYCYKPIQGRIDKKFCDDYCRASFHYNAKKLQDNSFYKLVKNQLFLNRKILKKFNQGGKVTVRKSIITDKGFNPNFFTHYWKPNPNKIYFFVFEFGFTPHFENSKDKYLLIHWQDYMMKGKT
jgi:predicted nucleic acid-binding Zn ribbon protein